MGAYGCKALSRGLESTICLVELHIENCKLRSEGGEHLGKGLAGNQTVEIVNAGKNALGDKGAVAIAKGLKKNKVLKVRVSGEAGWYLY